MPNHCEDAWVEPKFGYVEGELDPEVRKNLSPLLVGAFQEVLWIFWGSLAGWA